MSQFERTELLLGKDSTLKLKNSAVAVFGLGGVGGSLTEALARAGIGRFLLVDYDAVTLSNINRQVVALHSTVGLLKTDCMKKRILDINPNAQVETKAIRIDGQSIKEVDFSHYDYIADAVDDVAAKLEIIKKAKQQDRRVISCMGAGNRAKARFIALDISMTHSCPLAKKVREHLKKQGITGVKAVFCPDPPLKRGTLQDLTPDQPQCVTQAKNIGSVSFVPPAAGLFMAGEIVLDMLNNAVIS